MKTVVYVAGIGVILLFENACRDKTIKNQKAREITTVADGKIRDNTGSAFTPGVMAENKGKTGALPVPAKTVASLKPLIEAAHSGNREESEIAKGELIGRISVGMDKDHVEAWMGKGAREIPGDVIGSPANQLIATYYCRLPGRNGTHVMSVCYERKEGVIIVISVDGPHRPGE